MNLRNTIIGILECDSSATDIVASCDTCDIVGVGWGGHDIKIDIPLPL